MNKYPEERKGVRTLTVFSRRCSKICLDTSLPSCLNAYSVAPLMNSTNSLECAGVVTDIAEATWLED